MCTCVCGYVDESCVLVIWICGVCGVCVHVCGEIVSGHTILSDHSHNYVCMYVFVCVGITEAITVSFSIVNVRIC